MSEEKKDNSKKDLPDSSSQEQNNSNQTSSEMSFGHWLRSKREEKKISLEEIANKTKIQMKQLQELEDGWQGAPPATAFIRGFLVNYARQVGLDENEVLLRFKEDFGLAQHAGRNTSNRPLNTQVKITQTPSMSLSPSARIADKKEKVLINSKLVFTILVIVIFIGVISFLVNVGKKSVSQEKEEQNLNSSHVLNSSPEENNTTLIENLNLEQANNETENNPSVEESKVSEGQEVKKEINTAEVKEKALPVKKVFKIFAKKSTWINVRVDTRNSTGFQMKEGDTRTYTVNKRIDLSISDASAIEIEWDGQRYGSLGSQGEVKTIIIPKEIKSLKKI